MTITKDTGAQKCYFYVVMPPQGQKTRAAQRSFQLLQDLLRTYDDKVLNEFTSAVLESLIEPLKQSVNATLDANLASLQQHAGSITVCAAEGIKKNRLFEKFDDVISCGRVPALAKLIFEARLTDVTLALLLPLREEP